MAPPLALATQQQQPHGCGGSYNDTGPGELPPHDTQRLPPRSVVDTTTGPQSPHATPITQSRTLAMRPAWQPLDDTYDPSSTAHTINSRPPHLQPTPRTAPNSNLTTFNDHYLHLHIQQQAPTKLSRPHQLSAPAATHPRKHHHPNHIPNAAQHHSRSSDPQHIPANSCRSRLHRRTRPQLTTTARTTGRPCG